MLNMNLPQQNILHLSDMDGLGSPEHMMDHSMMDLKTSPYTWNSSPKIPYDVFQSNRTGKLSILVVCSACSL